MLMRTLPIVVVCAGSALGQNVMSFTWEHDAPDPARIQPGQEVVISLWAEWSPHEAGFAQTTFDVYDLAGGFAFFDDEAEYEARGGAVVPPGPVPPPVWTARDTDGDGQDDAFGTIDANQLPAFFNPGFDSSNPMLVMQIAWTAGNEPGLIELQRGASADGTFRHEVYLDDFGTEASLQPVDQTLRLRVIPGPGACVVLVLGYSLIGATRRQPFCTSLD